MGRASRSDIELRRCVVDAKLPPRHVERDRGRSRGVRQFLMFGLIKQWACCRIPDLTRLGTSWCSALWLHGNSHLVIVFAQMPLQFFFFALCAFEAKLREEILQERRQQDIGEGWKIEMLSMLCYIKIDDN
jgi:hypothetical protein